MKKLFVVFLVLMFATVAYAADEAEQGGAKGTIHNRKDGESASKKGGLK